MRFEADLVHRDAPLDMSASEFRELGHELIDLISDLLAGLPGRRVTPGETPAEVQSALGDAGLPEEGLDAEACLGRAFDLLTDHSLFNGHPRFLGYVTSSAAPIGTLADLLVSAVNPNAGAWILSPMATEIEAQTIRWIADFIGYPTECGGLLVSGGNMANFVGLLAARRAKAPWDVRSTGTRTGNSRHLVLYASDQTHTWVSKAADLFGLGTGSIRFIESDSRFRMRTDLLRGQIESDRAAGLHPFLLVGTGGTVSTGAVDPLPEMAAIAREYDLWLHVDGAYGAPAAAVPGVPSDLAGLSLADSVAVDPHKWMYAPLEAGCVLVRDSQVLRDTFEYSPPYYHFGAEGSEPLNYYCYGPQNSRSARAVKVWLALQVAGRRGMTRMIADDIRLAEAAYRIIDSYPGLEALTCGLSIVTFRYVPAYLDAADPGNQEYLNKLNETLVDRLQTGGEFFLSNAVVRGAFALRMCIVNFRTTMSDIGALPAAVVLAGAQVDAQLRRGMTESSRVG